MAELKTVGDKEIDFLKQHYWDKQCKKTNTWHISVLQQVKPAKAHLQVFEERRTELERKMPGGQKLNTIHLFYASTEQGIKNVLQNGFKTAGAGTLYMDPVDAIHHAPDHQILLCRVALGRAGDFGDFTFDSKQDAYNFKDLSQVMPAWLIYVKSNV